MQGPSEQRERGGKERREKEEPQRSGRSQEARYSTDPRAGGPARGLQGQGAVRLEPAPHFCITVLACRTKSWQPGLQETETLLSEVVHRLSRTLNSRTEAMLPEELGQTICGSQRASRRSRRQRGFTWGLGCWLQSFL